jgi:hypothetical protein
MPARLPNACRTHWIRGSTASEPSHWNRDSMAFHLAQRMPAVMLMVPAWPEFGFL